VNSAAVSRASGDPFAAMAGHPFGGWRVLIGTADGAEGTFLGRHGGALGPGQFAPTTDLHVQFLRPAHPGRLTGRGRIVRRGSSVAFLAGELADESGAVVAVATATAQIRTTQA
jgi:hypothetical protein